MQRVLSGFVRRKGLSLDAARAQLARTEPFDSWPIYIATLEISPETSA
jgi:hypothetical protein